MRKIISTLHFLTQDIQQQTHVEQVRMACEAGVKWIQLRVKSMSHDEWLKVSVEVKQITERFNVTLIINDSIEIAKAVGADGVHLGQQDQSPITARSILGDEKIVGYSTHSLDELLAAKKFPVDYFGLGPFRFTSTKQNLDPVLGLEGTRKIIEQARAAGIFQPIISIGGIRLKDVSEILETGARGLAVSAAINLTEHPFETATRFVKESQNSNLKLQTEV